jgi:hypothetical protein
MRLLGGSEIQKNSHGDHNNVHNQIQHRLPVSTSTVDKRSLDVSRDQRPFSTQHFNPHLRQYHGPIHYNPFSDAVTPYAPPAPQLPRRYTPQTSVDGYSWSGLQPAPGRLFNSTILDNPPEDSPAARVPQTKKPRGRKPASRSLPISPAIDIASTAPAAKKSLLSVSQVLFWESNLFMICSRY